MTDKSKTLTPLTVKQLSSGQDPENPSSAYMVDRVEVSLGRIVGRLVDINDDDTRCIMLVQDCTGSIPFVYYYTNSETWATKRKSLECVGFRLFFAPPSMQLFKASALF